MPTFNEVTALIVKGHFTKLTVYAESEMASGSVRTRFFDGKKEVVSREKDGILTITGPGVARADESHGSVRISGNATVTGPVVGVNAGSINIVSNFGDEPSAPLPEPELPIVILLIQVSPGIVVILDTVVGTVNYNLNV